MTTAHVYFASLTGNNEEVAEAVVTELKRLGVSATQEDLSEATIEALKSSELVVVVPYTYGAGDLPEEGLDLYSALATADLTGVVYGVIGSGDVAYGADFCKAVTTFDQRLHDTGATQGSPAVNIDLRLDDSDCPRVTSFVHQLVARLKEHQSW